MFQPCEIILNLFLQIVQNAVLLLNVLVLGVILSDRVRRLLQRELLLFTVQLHHWQSLVFHDQFFQQLIVFLLELSLWHLQLLLKLLFFLSVGLEFIELSEQHFCDLE